MLKRFLTSLGIIAAPPPAAKQSSPSFSPYTSQSFNYIYNLLFCDDLELFRKTNDTPMEEPWRTLLARKPDIEALRTLAENPIQESRLRVLAYNRLREAKIHVPPKKLLGVIIEVALEKGLDVLAAYPDGRLRYINQAEKMSIFETSPPEVEAIIKNLLEVSQLVVNQIGPWDKERLSPPTGDLIRMTFLVSDGLYFGQGPFAQMQADPKAGPVIAAGLELLNAVVDTSIEQEKSNKLQNRE